MDKRLIELMQAEVSSQCEFAILAHRGIQDSLAVSDADGLWFHIQSFLVAVGNISKLLWGTNINKYGVRKPLRDSLNVDEESPLKDRNLRNSFEHFDERLETWWATSPQRNIIDRCVISPGAIKGLEKNDLLRNLDPNDFTILFKGDEFSIPKVVLAVEGLRGIAIERRNAFIRNRSGHE